MANQQSGSTPSSRSAASTPQPASAQQPRAAAGAASTSQGAASPPRTPAERAVEIRLDELVVMPDVYGQRGSEALTEERLLPLKLSIKQAGLKESIKIWRDAAGKAVVLGGGRRVAAMRKLAEQGEPGFTLDMKVPAIELPDMNENDRKLWAILDNGPRDNYTEMELINVAKVLHELGFTADRAAKMLGYKSSKSFTRYRDIALNGWMVPYVENKTLGFSNAAALLEVATSKNRTAELKAKIEKHVADNSEAADGDNAAGDTMATPKISTALSNHWIAQMRANRQLTDSVPSASRIVLDASTLEVDGRKYDLTKDDPDAIAVALADVVARAKERSAQAKARRDLASHTGDSGPDLAFLRETGHADIAQDLEAKRRSESSEEGTAA